MNKPKTRLATIVALTLIALALSIPLLTAETSPNWQTAPTFQDTEAYNLTWTLAAGQPSPKIGDTVWAVPNVKNESGTLVPLASASPSPSPAPSAVPFTPDNDAVAVAAIVTIVLVAAMFGTLLAYRSHLSKKAVGAAAVTLLAFSCCAFLPLGSADQTATTGYKLATPTGSWDFQIKNYTDNSFGVVRGSDWANFMTFVGYVGGNPSNGLITPPWAGYSENASATWENIFANITYGVIESKEVAVGYSTGLEDWMTALPADVEVVCYYQGNTYQFTNPSNTAGSPYTVKVGEKMLAGNYTAEDAKGRITWTSTNASETINYCTQKNGTYTWLNDGLYPLSAGVLMNDNTVLDGTWNAHLKRIDGFTLVAAANIGRGNHLISNINYSTGEYIDIEPYRNYNITVKNIQVDGNAASQTHNDAGTIGGTIFSCVSGLTIENCWIHDSWDDSMGLWKNCTDVTIKGNKVLGWNGRITLNAESGRNGIGVESFGAGTDLGDWNIKVTDNIIDNSMGIGADSGIALMIEDSNNVEASGNTINQVDTGIYVTSIGENTGSFNLLITKNTVNETNDHGVLIGHIYNSKVTENSILNSNRFALYLQTSNSTIVNDNIFSKWSTNDAAVYGAITLYGGYGPCTDNVVAGNILNGGGYAYNTGGRGIHLESCQRIDVKNNLVCDTFGGNYLAYGVVLKTCDGCNVESNTVWNITHYNVWETTAYMTGTNRIVDNRGSATATNSTNPVGWLTNPILTSKAMLVAFSTGDGAIADETTYTNVQCKKDIYLVGGTVVSVTVNGKNLGTSTFIALDVNDKVLIDWSDAPTIFVYAH